MHLIEYLLEVDPSLFSKLLALNHSLLNIC